MASDAVYDFMKTQNRPFSINEIVQNVGKELGKSAIQKATDALVKKNVLFAKTYGKQTIYCVVQKDEDKESLQNELRHINSEIQETSAKIKDVEAKLAANSALLKQFNDKISVEEAKNKKEELEVKIKEMKEELERYSGNEELITEEERNEINKEYETQLKEYKKRKRICTDIINAILEGYPKTKKHLIEEIGIETDEDAGFKLE